jgi:hypothetical protein
LKWGLVTWFLTQLNVVTYLQYPSTINKFSIYIAMNSGIQLDFQMSELLLVHNQIHHESDSNAAKNDPNDFSTQEEQDKCSRGKECGEP